ncbi:galectin-4 isoform X2 [Esox lucius]|uniref:galectin-4 isoform X2 n=1 Tax=Esox lucius TaxID=8010 RepID=UPI00147711AC|nr:galectin-4 isoform X2 [Esox lucius]
MFVAPPGYQPIYNPCIPYIGPINGGLRSGMSIYIQGVVPHHVTRFHMSLMCAEMDGSDVGFHISPCFQGWDKVVFNHFEGGRWGSEEKTHHMPFRKGEAFEMVITVIQEGFQVKVNGKHFHMFNHRLAIERICALQIGGDISIQTINVIGGGFPAGGYPGGQMGGGYPGGMAGGMGGGMAVAMEDGMPGGMGVVMEGGMGGGYPGGMGVGIAGGYPGGPGGYPGGPGGYPCGPGGYPGGPGGYPGGPGGYPDGNMPVVIGQPIFNPTVPFSSLIPGGMSHKKTIIIRGMIPLGANRLSIYFVLVFYVLQVLCKLHCGSLA